MNVREDFKKGVLAQRRGQLGEAERKYNAVLDVNPKHAEASHNLGTILLANGDFVTAASHFKTAVDSDPRQEQFWLSYASSLIKAEEFEQVVLSLQQAMSSGVSKKAQFQISLSMAKSARQSGQFQLAETAYFFALELKPDETSLYSSIAGVMRDQGRLEDAAEAYQIAIQLDADDADAQVDFGLTLQKLGKSDMAESCFLNALKIDPLHALANNNLGTLLNEIGRETEAIRYYVRAIEINPDQAVFHFNLANTHTLLGNDYQALQSYKEALRIDPRMDESIARRGKLLLQQGKHREGLERLRMAEGHISISYSEICIH